MKKRLVLSAIVIVVALFIVYEFILPRIPKPLITKDQVVSNQMQYLDSFYTGNCTTLAYQETQGTNPIYVNESSSLLLAYTEMYKITKDQKHLSFATLEASCIQNQFTPLDVEKLRATMLPIGSLSTDDVLQYYLSNNLLALSYYSSLTSQNPSYLGSIANYLSTAQVGNNSAEDYIISKQKLVIALLQYYDISKNQSLIDNAMSMLNALEQDATLRTTGIDANFLTIYSKLYQINPTQNIVKIVQNYANSLSSLQSSDGSFSSDSLQTIRASVGLDACVQATNNISCRQILDKTLSYLAGKIGIGKLGLIINNTQTTSVDSQLAVLLVKYQEGWTV